MRYSILSLLVFSSALGLSGCKTLEYEAYYANPEDGPRIFELRDGQESEKGNLGGREVTIEGQNFGDDPGRVVVYFDSLNAEILEVTDEALRVRTPRGPLQGGAVNVYVATEDGIAQANDVYTYEVGDLFSNEVAHISAGNYWRSCLGGGEDVETDEGGPVGCDGVTYNGQTGTTGSAEFFEFIFPRIHTQNVGFLWATDEAGEGEGWKVETPAQVAFSLAVDDLRKPVGDFTLTNDVWEDKYWCAKLDGLGQWVYGGGDGKAQKVVGGNVNLLNGRPRDGDFSCDGDLLPMAELRYCEVPEYGGAHSNEYEAFWPVGRSFFSGGSGNQGHTKSATVGLELPGAGISGVEVDLPEPLVVRVMEGMAAADQRTVDVEGTCEQEVVQSGHLWTVGPGVDDCFDDDGDLVSSLDEVAMKFRWLPSEVVHSEEDAVPGQTRVRFGLTVISVGWFGAESYPVRATISMPDRHETIEIENEETGELEEWSTVEVPVSVLYQFPTTNIDFFSAPSEGLGGSSNYRYGNPLDVGQGYFLLTADRVTEYAVPSAELGGDVVLSYSTGDFGFYGWEHPNERGPCGNCADDDGDGWLDDDDPDCAVDDRELGFTANCIDDGGLSVACECNDGLDNDGDGLTDHLDPDCSDGLDDQELVGDCCDGDDSDGDGWVDFADPDCLDDDGGELPDGFEEGFTDLVCNDGLDNDEDGFYDTEDDECVSAEDGVEDGTDCSNGFDDDSDGWFDAEDPDCASPTDTEDGFGSNQCNDGIDNDGHGDVDADDPTCQANGANSGNESEGVTKLDCTNGLDDDGDGFIDIGDPDCEFGQESGDGFVSDDPPECSDGVDNDGDGMIDPADPGCWNQGIACSDSNGDGVADAACADGFLDDESFRHPCEDGVDNDGDGWTDEDDPECYDAEHNDFGVLIGQEAGLGSNGCNNGDDDDGDGWTDGVDPGCTDAISDEDDGFLGGSSCNDGLDNDADGWFDSEDPVCLDPLLAEDDGAAGATECNDGLDNDADGWFDSEDPACLDASLTEDDGAAGATECNDGLDNDGDTLVDSEDTECVDAADDDEGA